MAAEAIDETRDVSGEQVAPEVTESAIKKMKRGDLNELAAQYGLNPDDYARADQLRSAIFEYLQSRQQPDEEPEAAAKEQATATETAEEQTAGPKPNPPRSRIQRRGKKYRAAHEKIDKDAFYGLEEAAKLLPDTSTVNFDAAAELHVKLGVDTKQADQLVRGTVVLPHGSGKTKTVAAVVPEGKEKEVKQAGADAAGHQSMLDKIAKGDIDFDVLVAHPDVMKELSPHAKTLGPQGLMPNPKAGTVSDNVADTVGELKSGRVEYRVDRYGSIHQVVGRVSFSPQQLQENVLALVQSILQARPSSLKGTYLRKAYLTTTMGPSIKLDTATLTRGTAG
jgi:large subunit ribosomal protein L1